MEIKFGTDGWRAVIADQFTVEGVARVTIGAALWLQKQPGEHSVIIGHDCRFGGKLFAQTTAEVFSHYGIKVFLAEGIVSTPMVSLGTKKCNASLGVVITASHNPPEYNGYKLKGAYGGPLLPQHLSEVEALIPDKVQVEALYPKIELIHSIDLENLYVQEMKQQFNLEAIRESGLSFAYDAMYGSGQDLMKRLFPSIHHFRCEKDPLFHGISPEPLKSNLSPFSSFIKNISGIACGLATDGDADRIGLLDGKGNFIDSHHILLLLIYYLCEFKKQRGKVACGFSSSVKIKQLCDHYGLELEVVPIGFKHICGLMVKEDLLVGGEESGGIAARGFIPERDGIRNGLLVWEMLVSTGKSLNELVNEIYDIVGAFAFQRVDLRLEEPVKQSIVDACKAGFFNEKIGPYPVHKVENLDGFKYYLSENEWVMVRPSGTEPVLRVYAEATDEIAVTDILNSVQTHLLSK